jgi:hypothetical protein
MVIQYEILGVDEFLEFCFAVGRIHLYLKFGSFNAPRTLAEDMRLRSGWCVFCQEYLVRAVCEGGTPYGSFQGQLRICQESSTVWQTRRTFVGSAFSMHFIYVFR